MRNTLLLLGFPMLLLLFTLFKGGISYMLCWALSIRKRLTTFLLLIACSAGFAQPVLPRSLHPGITVKKLINTQVSGVRVVMNRSTNTLYYHSWAGDIFRIEQPPSGSPYEVTIASAAQHGINYLQGMVFSGNTMILTGNYKQAGQKGIGLVVKGTQQANGSWQWTRIVQTVPYQSSTALYDHAISAVVVTPGGDSVYVASGSRTDHGEVEDTDGLYPNTRETALTSVIFKFPIQPNATIILPNDSAALYASGYVFCRGVRNEFDMALDGKGRLFGVENSGDRDDPEEMNWLRAGHHYGFPWELGGNQTPMQFPGYDPTKDKLLPADLSQFQRDRFHNDPGYPARPANLVITQPVQSVGPNARYVHDPVTGQWQPGSLISTFTAHRSPVGLSFDNDSLLADFMGGAFVLAYSAGGGVRGGYLPAEDPGEDLSFVRLTYQPASQNFTAVVTRVADQFIKPTDTELVGNTLYVIEEGRQAIWRLTLRPALTDVSLAGRTSTLTPGVGEPLTVTLTATNDGPQHASKVVIQNRLPPNVQVISAGALLESNGVLTSLPVGIDSGQSATWTYQLRPMVAGTYLNMTQVLSQVQPDSDSQPGSGTGDGQDDATTLSFRTREQGGGTFVSPNPDQVVLPNVQSNQPIPPVDQADLSLALTVDQRTPVVNQVLTYTLIISNRGGARATNVTIQVRLSDGLSWAPGGDVNESGMLPAPIAAIAAGSATPVIVRVKATAAGSQLCQVQLIMSSPADPDSTPGNGFANGEDDTAQCDIRVR